MYSSVRFVEGGATCRWGLMLPLIHSGRLSLCVMSSPAWTEGIFCYFRNIQRFLGFGQNDRRRSQSRSGEIALILGSTSRWPVSFGGSPKQSF